jgi:DNA polymerase iota
LLVAAFQTVLLNVTLLRPSSASQLVIVNGEDLTLYRRYSRQVFTLVRQIVGSFCPVEKLGMDELFIDVTSLIISHVQSPSRGFPWTNEAFFALPSSSSPIENVPGFVYNPDFWAGHVAFSSPSLGSASDPSSPSPSPIPSSHSPYRVASHLAFHIRSQILSQIGLTSSAGISPSKLLSKLLASEHKPADQTSADLPVSALSWDDKNDGGAQERVQEWLDSMELRRLNGFGSSVVEKIVSALPPAASVSANPPSATSSSPTVHTTRTSLSLTHFTTLFPSPSSNPRPLAQHLWSLLHAQDTSPVIPSPLYPAQISVEDSYAACSMFDWERLEKEVRRLGRSLCVRLEEELTVGDEGKGKGRKRWVRWYNGLRVSMRKNWDGPNGQGRESKSTALPAVVFDLLISPEERVQKLMGGGGARPGKAMGGMLGGLVKGLVGSGDGPFELYV